MFVTAHHVHAHVPIPIEVWHSGDFNDEEQMRKLNHLIIWYELWTRMMSDKKVWSEDMARASNSFECVTTTELFYQIFNSSESFFH